MTAAKRNGKHVGRLRKFAAHQVAHGRELIESDKETRAGVAALFGVDVATLRRALRESTDLEPVDGNDDRSMCFEKMDSAA